MLPLQIICALILSVFYIAYFAKALLLKRRGIHTNLLGKSDKPPSVRLNELLLRAITLLGAIVQFASVLFANRLSLSAPPFAVRVVGIIFASLGCLLFLLALHAMQDSWRAGFDKNQDTKLINSGVYRISRNPAFLGFDLLYIGCAMAFPHLIHVLVALIALVLFHFQILGEEAYCAEAFGDAYILYKSKTRRYFGIQK